MIAFTLKTMFWKYSWTMFWKYSDDFFLTEKLFFACQTTRKLTFNEEVAFIQRSAA